MASFHRLGKFDVLAWSVSGMETCIVVKDKKFSVCFDMGYCPEDAIFCEYVFIRYVNLIIYLYITIN